MKWTRNLLPLIGALAGLAGDDVEAQRPTRDTTLAAVVGEVRAGVPIPPRAISVLSQARGRESPLKLQALVDSLVQIAIAWRPGGPFEDYKASLSAQAALGIAGNRTSAVPYPGAFAAHVRVYEGSEDTGVRASTLWTMTQLADQTQVLSFLRSVATSDDRVAYRAVELMADDMGPEGLAVLRAFASVRARNAAACSDTARLGRRAPFMGLS